VGLQSPNSRRSDSTARRAVREGLIATVLTIIFGCTLLLGAGLMGTETAAYGATGVGNANCPHGYNWTSSACYFNYTWQYGTYSEWNSNTLGFIYLPTGTHINRSIWAYSECDKSAFVEAGLWTQTTGTYYYASYFGHDGHMPTADLIYPAATDGSHHYYRISFVGPSQFGGIYNVLIDGVLVRTYGAQGLSGTCISQAGLEQSAVSCTYVYSVGYVPDGCSTSASTDSGPLAWQDTSYNYSYGWDVNNWWIDWACYPYNALAIPNCFVGQWPSGNMYWRTQK
jgi:hypothetical protein